MAFFTDFTPCGDVGLLDWYTVSVALFAAVVLAAHGATYLTLKTEGAVHDRSASYARVLWAAAAPLLLVISVESAVVRPDLLGHAIQNPFWWLGLLLVCAAAITLISGLATRREMRAFIGSNLLLAGLLATGAAAIFPVVLHSTLAPENSLTVYDVAAGPKSLAVRRDLVADRFRAGGHVFRFRLATICRKGQRQTRQPGLLLSPVELPGNIFRRNVAIGPLNSRAGSLGDVERDRSSLSHQG